MERRNERRVVCIIDSENAGYFRLARKARDEFRQLKPGNMGNSVSGGTREVYLFGTVEDAEVYGRLLDERNIPFSYHPARDFTRVSTEDMDETSAAMFASIDKSFGEQ